MPDDAQNILSPVQVDNSIKANAWEAFNSAKNEDELGVRLQGINLPQDTKAQLWEAKKKAAGMQIPDATAQAQAFTRSQIKPLIPGTGTVDPTGGLTEAQKTPAYQGYMKASGQMAASAAGGMAGGALVAPLLPGAQAAGGSGALGWLLPKLASTSGMGIGGGVGAFTQGASPGQALEASAGGTMAGMAMEGGTAGVKKVWGAAAKKLSTMPPEQFARVQAAIPKEQAIAQTISEAEPASRAAFKAAADNMGIDAAHANIAGTRNLANEAMQVAQKYGYKTPSAVGSISRVYEPTVEDLGKNLPEVMQSDNPNTILQQLKQVDTMPFRDLQRRVADIEQWISRNNPNAELYKSLKAVANSGKAALQATAENEGKAAQYQVFKKMFQDHVDDFWDKNAPLRPWTGNNPRIEQDMTGKTVNEFLNNAKMGRVLEALDRRGISTKDIRGIIAQETRSPGSVAQDMTDASRLQAVGRGPLDERTALARKAVAKKVAIGAGASAIGAGGLYEFAKRIATARPQRP